eukprot:10479199-Lingulodinium_polyedra.AAC.1
MTCGVGLQPKLAATLWSLVVFLRKVRPDPDRRQCVARTFSTFSLGLSQDHVLSLTAQVSTLGDWSTGASTDLPNASSP